MNPFGRFPDGFTVPAMFDPGAAAPIVPDPVPAAGRVTSMVPAASWRENRAKEMVWDDLTGFQANAVKHMQDNFIHMDGRFESEHLLPFTANIDALAHLVAQDAQVRNQPEYQAELGKITAAAYERQYPSDRAPAEIPDPALSISDRNKPYFTDATPIPHSRHAFPATPADALRQANAARQAAAPPGGILLVPTA